VQETVMSGNTPNRIVVAGAGTGKTHALVGAYIDTLLGIDNGGKTVAPSRILAITFTEKAAAEMRSRVTRVLAELAHGGSDVYDVGNRLKALGLRLPSRFELLNLIWQLPGAPICTFHAYCARLLGQHAQLRDLDESYTLLSPEDNVSLMTDIAERVILSWLDGEAGQDASHLRPLVARYGLRTLFDRPGLAESVVQLLHRLGESAFGADALRVVGEQEHEGNQLTEALRAQSHAVDVALETFRAQPNSQKTSERLDDAAKQWAFLRALLIKCAYDPVSEHEIPLAHAYATLRVALKGNFGNREARQQLCKAVVTLGSSLVNCYMVREAHIVKRLIGLVGSAVRIEKRRLSALSFSDLLIEVHALLAEHPQARQQTSHRYARIFVDEFQDTSPIQEDIVAMLSGEATEILPKAPMMATITPRYGSLYIVGDPKQSIYSFRGAEVRVFSRTLETITREGGARIDLKVCRRSQGAIVELVNAVAASTLPAFDESQRLSAMRPAQSKAGALWLISTDVSSEEEENISVPRAIALKVRDLVLQNPDLAFGDIGILVRRAKVARALFGELLSLNIPATLGSGDGFYERSEIRDVAAMLYLLVEPEDTLALLVLLRSPFVLLTDAEIIRLLSTLQREELSPTLRNCLKKAPHSDLTPGGLSRLQHLGVLHETLEQGMYINKPSALIERMLLEGPLAFALSAQDDRALCLANVKKLMGIVDNLSLDPGLACAALWERVQNPPKEALADLSETHDVVRIMTIHQSKGLEFPVVIIADTETRDPPETAAIVFDVDAGLALSHRGRPIAAAAPDSSEEKFYAPTTIDIVRNALRKKRQDELARLLYVALTRARDRLYFVCIDRAKQPAADGTLAALFLRTKQSCPELFSRLMDTELIA
jgi:ATP-dependent helicase/nuclease subunit A